LLSPRAATTAGGAALRLSVKPMTQETGQGKFSAIRQRKDGNFFVFIACF
jgi:hypothetical protein